MLELGYVDSPKTLPALEWSFDLLEELLGLATRRQKD
jgi:hypothetical protein